MNFFKRKSAPEPVKMKKFPGFNSRRKLIVEAKMKEYEKQLNKRSLGLTSGDRLEDSADAAVTLLGSFNNALKGSAQRLFNQGRGLAINTSLGSRYVQYMADNVVGTGLDPKPMVQGADGKLDDRMNDEIEKAFWNWAQSQRRFSRNGRFNFRELLAMAEKERIQGGECFIVMDDSADDLKYTLLSAEMVDWTYSQRVDDEVVIYQGIEYDEDTLMPRAYWFRKRDLLTQTFTGKHYRVPAEKVMHYYIPATADALRGVTDFLPVIKDIAHRDAFREAVIIQKRIASSSMGFIESSKDSADNFDIDEEEGYYQRETITDFAPGSIQELAPGQTIKQLSSSQSGDDFKSFDESMLTAISMGLGVFKQGLTGDTASINYSSARFGDLSQRTRFKSIQDRLIDLVVKPIVEAFLKHAVMHSSINLRMAKVNEVMDNTVIIRPKYQSVDPQKDINTEIAMISNGLKSRSASILERGDDPEKVFSEIEAEKTTINKVVPAEDNPANS
ncbi:phage portal protein [Edwardsiella tarda]|uniref:Phage portal protein n=1 Tax=Edwardsiella tarda TaxID=636 RepID=A0A2A7U7E4_EDWTA|nr:phage portal protein [Edwardsiella tarda]PEH74285.1 phage portal protein [Edwardsiella tarda]